MVTAAVASQDYRWALELASWLEKATDDQVNRDALANVIRLISQRTTSANIRNWCLTKALELEGTINLSRFREHRFRMDEVLAKPPGTFVKVLRVLLMPERTADLVMEVRWRFDDGSTTGLKIRQGIAIPTDGIAANDEINITHADWAKILGGKLTYDTAVAEGKIQVSGNEVEVKRFFRSFDHPSFSG